MIQETQSFGLLDIVKWLIPSGSVFALLTIVWAKYFRIRPKVWVNINWGGATSSPKEDGGFRFTYTPRLTLHNDSNFVARRITIVDSSDITHWQFTGQLPTRLEPDAKYECEFNIDSAVSRQNLVSLFGETIANTTPCQQYFPYAVGNATLIISYDNEKDTTFYTLFTFIDRKSRSHFRRRKPNLKKRANGS